MPERESRDNQLRGVPERRIGHPADTAAQLRCRALPSLGRFRSFALARHSALKLEQAARQAP
jgi:hypothetical protein